MQDKNLLPVNLIGLLMKKYIGDVYTQISGLKGRWILASYEVAGKHAAA